MNPSQTQFNPWTAYRVALMIITPCLEQEESFIEVKDLIVIDALILMCCRRNCSVYVNQYKPVLSYISTIEFLSIGWQYAISWISKFREDSFSHDCDI